MFDIENFDADEMKAIHKRLSQFSRAELVSIAKDFSKWKWPAILGDTPIQNWENAPNYRRRYMGKEIQCRSDYIDPYMAVLRVMGITNDDIYECEY